MRGHVREKDTRIAVQPTGDYERPAPPGTKRVKNNTKRFYIDPDVVRFLDNPDALSTEITIWRHGGDIWHPEERKISGAAIPCDLIGGFQMKKAYQSLSERAIKEVEE